MKAMYIIKNLMLQSEYLGYIHLYADEHEVNQDKLLHYFRATSCEMVTMSQIHEGYYLCIYKKDFDYDKDDCSHWLTDKPDIIVKTEDFGEVYLWHIED